MMTGFDLEQKKERKYISNWIPLGQANLIAITD